MDKEPGGTWIPLRAPHMEERLSGTTAMLIRMARKSNGSPGNHRRDREWIEQHRDQLILIEDGEYAGMLQWDGTEDTRGSAWNLPDKANTCTAWSYIRDADGNYVIDKKGKRLTRPCYAWKIKGANVCLKHGGGTPAVRQKAKERLALSVDAAIGRLASIAFDKNAKTSDQLRALEALLSRAGITAGLDEMDGSETRFRIIWERVAKAAGQSDDESEADEDELVEDSDDDRY